MAKLTPKQSRQYAVAKRKLAEAEERGWHWMAEGYEKEIALLEAVMARTGKQHVYREAHEAHVLLWGEQMVERVNLMSGKPYMEKRNTPAYLSPACESYWSM